MINDVEKEELRHVVLEIVVARHPAAVGRKTIQNETDRQLAFDQTLADVVSAIEFHVGMGNFIKLTDDFGSTDRWQATPGGMLMCERAARNREPRRD
jgi:hypothetical protein